MATGLKVIARLTSPLAGDPPYLDAMLEFEMSQRLGKAERIQRGDRLQPYGAIHIPMLRKTIGGMLVPCCSAPILSPTLTTREHFAKRLAVEQSDLLHPSKRRIVAVGNSTFKSYRLPLTVRHVASITWFAVAHRRPVKSLLRSIHSVGHKRSQGYGRVREWVFERIEEDYSWFVPSESGPVLMRSLPWCDEIPENIIGAKRDFGACQPPMWHPDRFVDIVVPC